MGKINNWVYVEFKNDYTIIIFGKIVSYDEFIQYMWYYRNLLNSKRKIIFDLKLIEHIPCNIFLEYIAFIEKMKPIHRKNLEIFYLIFNENSYIKNLIELAFTIIKPVTPYKIINNYEDVINYRQD